MRTIFWPGFSISGRLSLIGNLLLLAALFFIAQLLSLYWAVSAAIVGHATSVLDHERWVSAAVILIFGAALYLLAAFVLWSRIGIQRLSKAAERIASGDLSVRQGAGRGDSSEAGAMWASITRMAENLAAIVEEVHKCSQSIHTGSKEIADGHVNLSERTEKQASTLEETASGMDELATTVRQNADNCRRASERARASSTIAANASASMRQVTATIGKIDASSKKVAEILGVIDGIAFQTNILALNAAVEAARAGEQGRGFAVVASEVRTLAQRSAAAAKEVKALIAESVANVAEGARLVRDTEKTLTQAVESVAEVSAVIGDIASASAEQSVGLEEIKNAIAQLDSVTQQNAALVEQSAAAAMSFEDAAARLAQAVSAFKFDRAQARERAIALVKRGIAHLREHGPQKAFSDFSDQHGGFVEGERYLGVLDMNCTVRANGGNAALVGENHADIEDVDGKKFAAESVSVARARGRGWVDYRWPNPRTGRVEPKSTYVEREGDYVLLCGIYASEEAEARPARAAGPTRRPGPRTSLPRLPR